VAPHYFALDSDAFDLGLAHEFFSSLRQRGNGDLKIPPFCRRLEAARIRQTFAAPYLSLSVGFTGTGKKACRDFAGILPLADSKKVAAMKTKGLLVQHSLFAAKLPMFENKAFTSLRPFSRAGQSCRLRVG
jgi:hypothetical protein